MLNRLGLETYIRWSGVDKKGHLQAHIFQGTKKSLVNYLKHHHITLLASKREFTFKKYKTSKKLVTAFTQDLATLLKTEINLMDALQLLKYRYVNEHMQTVISTTIQRLHAGQTLSDALAQYPTLFPPFYLQLIKAAETTHQLPLILSQLAKQQTFMSQLKNKITKALIYPSAVLLFTLLITIGLVVFALPQFQSIFNNFNAQLPQATQIILQISHILQKNKLLLGLSCLITPALFYITYKKSQRFLIFLQYLIMHTPWLHKLYRHKLVANWSYMMCLCIQSHLPLRQALALANDTITHISIKKSSQQVIEWVNAGHALHEALTHVRLFDLAQLYLIQIGESSHTLGDALERISKQAYSNIEHSLDSLSKWLEPVIMLVLSLIAGGLIISMYLPIFKIGTIL